ECRAGMWRRVSRLPTSVCDLPTGNSTPCRRLATEGACLRLLKPTPSPPPASHPSPLPRTAAHKPPPCPTRPIHTQPNFHPARTSRGFIRARLQKWIRNAFAASFHEQNPDVPVGLLRASVVEKVPAIGRPTG